MIWNYNGNTKTITISGTGEMKDYWDISDTPWYIYQNSIEKVIVEDGVKNVGRAAFRNCMNLKTVIFPQEGFTSIGDSAFSYCYWLKNITFPDSLMYIGERAFEDDSALSEIEIPQKVEKVLSNAFANCNLKTVVVNEGVKEIGENAFRTQKIYLPSTIEKIGENGIYGYTTDESVGDTCVIYGKNSVAQEYATQMDGSIYVDISSLIPIGDIRVNVTNKSKLIANPISDVSIDAFYKAQGGELLLEEDEDYTYTAQISADKKNVRISVNGMGLFTGTANVTVDLYDCGESDKDHVTWTFDKQMRSLIISGTGAMESYTNKQNAPWTSYNDKIQKIVIKEGITSIGNNNFKNIYNLKSVSMPDSTLKTIKKNAFINCTIQGDMEIPETVNTLESSAFANCTINKFVLPGSIKIMPDSLFDWGGYVNSLIINEGVTFVDGSMIRNVSRIYLPKSVTSISDYTGDVDYMETVFMFGQNTAAKKFAKKLDKVIYIDISNLISVSDVKVTLNNAGTILSGKDAAPEYEISYMVGSQEVPLSQEDCTVNYTIDSQKGIVAFDITGNGYFTGTKHVEKSLYCCGPNGEDSIIWKFDEADGTLTVSGNGIMDNFPDQTYVPWQTYRQKIKKVVVSQGITSIGDRAFQNCENMESIELPQSLETIGESAFYHCYKLKSVDIPSHVLEIGEDAFDSCYSLESVTIPGSVDTLKSRTFIYANLKSITLEEGVYQIDDDAIWAGRVYLPATVEKFSDYAMEGTDDSNGKVVLVGKNDEAKAYAKNCEYIVYVDAKATRNINKADISISGLHSANENDVEICVSYAIGDQNISLLEGTDYTIEVSIDKEKGEVSITLAGLGIFEGTKNCSRKLQGCGEVGNEDSVVWQYVPATRTLNITGNGKMADYENDGKPWAKYRNSIENIVIGEGVLSIGIRAFCDMDNLKNVTIADTVTSMGRDAFGWDYALRNVVIPDSVTEIGKSAFTYNYGLENVTVPGSVHTIQNNTFYASGLSTLKLEEGVTTIEAESIDAKIVYLPSTITQIDENAFMNSSRTLVYGCSNAAKEMCQNSGIAYIDTTTKYQISDAYVDKEDYTIYANGSEQMPYIYAIRYAIGSVTLDLAEGKDYTVSYENNINPGTAKMILTGEGYFTGTKEIEYEIKGLLSNCVVTPEYLSVAYDGNKKDPVITVTDGEKTLENDKDFSVSYANDIEEGMATFTVTGKGIYEGEYYGFYNIYKTDIQSLDITTEYSSTWYDGTKKDPAVTIKDGEKELKQGVDYTVSYASDIEEGMATATITGTGKYTGSHTIVYTISKKSAAGFVVDLSYVTTIADGVAKEPAVTVKNTENKVLVKDKDYVVNYVRNVNPGTAKAIINGIGLYKGTVEANFTIQAVSLESAEIILNETLFSYDGSPKKPDVTVKLGNQILTEKQDYVLSYKNNVSQGEASVWITGTGIYGQTISMSYTILPPSSSGEAIYDKDSTLISNNLIYTILDDEENEVEVTGISNKSVTTVDIPTTLVSDGVTYKVTSVGQKAFYKNTKITSVTIGNNVTSIENYAFYGCKNMSSLKIGARVELIGTSAFRKCTKLKSVMLPKSLEELGRNAFYGCSKLKTITIKGTSVLDIQDNAFKGISKKAVIKVPKKKYKAYKAELSSDTGYLKSMKIKKA